MDQREGTKVIGRMGGASAGDPRGRRTPAFGEFREHLLKPRPSGLRHYLELSPPLNGPFISLRVNDWTHQTTNNNESISSH